MTIMALELRKRRWTDDAIRDRLLRSTLPSGRLPCSETVEEVMRAVRLHPLYSYKCLWCGQIYSEKADAAVCCCDVSEGWECNLCGKLHSEVNEARECCNGTAHGSRGCEVSRKAQDKP